MPIHNLWLTELATNSKGETLFFLPAFGYLLLIMGTAIFLINNWGRVKEIGWGDKRIVGCLLFIVLAIALSGANADGWQGKIAPLGMGLALLAVYLVARILGKEMFLPLAVGAGIASLGVIVHGLMYRGEVTGGFVFEGNYDIVVGYVLLGTALFYHHKQWLLASLALFAMFLSGSPEAVFACGVIAIIVLLRKDWSKKSIPIISSVIIMVIIWFGLGYGQQLYSYTVDTVLLKPNPSLVSPNQSEEDKGNIESTIEYRAVVIKHAMSNLKPLGEGYNLTDFSKQPNVHNVPLVIAQQLGWPGILAGLAWLWVSLWCLIKTRLKYAWTLILALSVFDHYIWTELAPWWWCLVGIASASSLDRDYIFRKEV